MEPATWIIRYTGSNFHELANVKILDNSEELTIEEFIESIDDVEDVIIGYTPGLFMDEIHVYENNLRIVVGSLRKLSELNKLWEKPINAFTVHDSIPQTGAKISNFCKQAKSIEAYTNILSMCPYEYRSKITSMPIPEKWKSHQYIPGCEYKASWRLPEGINLNLIDKLYIYSANTVLLEGTFKNLRLNNACGSELMGLTTYLLDVNDLCVCCYDCSGDSNYGGMRQYEHFAHFLSNIRTHRLDIGINWYGDFDPSLVNITGCHLRAYNIWINGRRVSIKSLNQIIKLNMSTRFLTTKSSRNIG